MTQLTEYHTETSRTFCDLTLEDIQSWELITKASPAGGKCYYNEHLDLCAMHYPGTVKIFYSREDKTNKGMHPVHFEYKNLLRY